jgi:hypothetical protein
MKSRSRKKVAVTSSRMKAFVSFQDLFQSGFKSGWKFVRGSWRASSNVATSDTPTLQYPLVSVPMSSPNVTISIKNPGIGTGAALWVTDSGDWWGLVSSQVLSSGTGACGNFNAYNPCSGSNPINPCGATNPVSGGNCVATGGNCNSTPGNCLATGGNCVATGGNCNSNPTVNPTCNTSEPVFSNCNTRYGNCNTSGGNCNTSGGNCNTGGGNCRSFGYCLIYGSYYISCCKSYNPYNPCVNVNYFNPCVNVNYFNPCVNVNPTDYCFNINPYIPRNNCVNINSYIAGNPCVNTNYRDPCGYTNYLDPCGTTNQGNPCSGVNQINYCGATNQVSGGNCAQTGGNCNASGGTCASYNNTYPRSLQFIRFINNAATAVYTITLDSLTQFVEMKGLKVTISNAVKGGTTATITAKAFSDTAMVSQIGGDLIYNATNVKIIANYGIVASPSSYNELNTVGEITIQ